MSRKSSKRIRWWVIAAVLWGVLWIVGTVLYNRATVPDVVAEPTTQDIVTPLNPGEHQVVLYHDTYPMLNGVKTIEGYPVFYFECDEITTICVDAAGYPIGQIEEAAFRLPPINPRSMKEGTAICKLGLCYDNRGRLIGSDPRNFHE